MESFIEKIRRSIVDPTFGKYIKNDYSNSAMKFLLIFMLLIGCITMTVVSYKIHTETTEIINFITSDFPDFELKNGQLSCQGKMPIVKESSNSIMIVDTKGQISEDTLNAYPSGFIITSSKCIYKKSSIETRTYNFSDIKQFNLNKKELIHYIDAFRIPVIILVFILGVIFLYIIKLIGVLFLTLIAFLVDKFLDGNNGFETLFRMSIYAIIIPSIIQSTMGIFEINIPYFFIVYYAIAVFFLHKYIQAAKLEDIEENSDHLEDENL